MGDAKQVGLESGHLRCPVLVICPVCHGPLIEDNDTLTCSNCHKRFGFRNGFPDLIVGGRFEDPTDEELMLYEEHSNADLTINYWLPLFRRLWPSREPVRRLLSVGCGTGVDVDLLTEAGFDCIGIDCGNRTNVWPRRRNQNRLVLANGMFLPFEGETFDGVFCGCVFPHVGVVGDSFQVTTYCHRERLALAREMARMLKPGGKIVVSSPNRLFPLDIFHGRKRGSYRPRLNWPRDPFLLSVGDYGKLFRQAGCTNVNAQPVEGYWGFIRSKHSLTGFLLALPIRLIFWLVSRKSFSFLRSSPVNPWIVVLTEKHISATGRNSSG